MLGRFREQVNATVREWFKRLAQIAGRGFPSTSLRAGEFPQRPSHWQGSSREE